MVLAKCGPCLHIPGLGWGGGRVCVSIPGVVQVSEEALCANVCVFQTVYAPQKNKMSFHQAIT